MLPKEERQIISKIGRYKYNKMKDMNLSYDEFLKYEEKKEQEKSIKEKIGYRTYDKMKELGLNFEEYKQYQKEQKFKKYERKKEKDKIRFKTIRYLERYCSLEMRCQICNIKENIQIHHPNYNDYLKINLLCKKHHDKLHNFELIPPQIINLEEIAIKKPIQKQRQNYMKEQIENIKIDILYYEFSYKDLEEKYKVTSSTIKRYLLKQDDYFELEKKIKENGRKKLLNKINTNKDNPLLEYKQKYNLTSKDISKITNIPLPTIRAIECGKTDLTKIKPLTKQKLKILLTNKNYVFTK